MAPDASRTLHRHRYRSFSARELCTDAEPERSPVCPRRGALGTPRGLRLGNLDPGRRRLRAQRPHRPAPAVRSRSRVPKLRLGRRGRSAGAPLMLSATRRARQLFRGLRPVPRMGDSASKIVSPQEALPGRKDPIAVAGKDAGALGGRGGPRSACVPVPGGASSARRSEGGDRPPSGIGWGLRRRGGARRGRRGEDPPVPLFSPFSLQEHKALRRNLGCWHNT